MDGATGALADAPVVSFDEPRSLSLEYGEYWTFVARSAGVTPSRSGRVKVEPMAARTARGW